jgi:transposase
MFHIRTVKTASKANAVQIIKYENRKRVIVKHIGSAHDKEKLKKLKETAASWIEQSSKQQTLFPKERISIAEQYQYVGFRYAFVYESLYKLCKHFKFHLLKNQLLVDLVIARIIEPGSKLQSIEFLKEFVGIEHRREYFYRQIPEFQNLKRVIESKILKIAVKEFNFDFSLVFYDVTTLYFESSESDELRQCGFSKDNKFNQPQILLGLLVSSNGFPVGYQIFEGKKFEGHTLIPVILRFKRKHKIEKFTVVADAAMISSNNIIALRSVKLKYIVGARVANLSLDLIKTISARLNRNDGATIRIETEYGDLICEFSEKRYSKDKGEMENYISKAEILLKNPGKIKRAKFITSEHETYRLNTALIEKAELLLGIKGYYTNLARSSASDQLIISHYRNLWHVEQDFRITKSDLQIRPIYHFKEKMIEAHILICFMALAICKYIELKTGRSTKSILKLLKGVTDARLVEIASGEEFTLRSEIGAELKQQLEKIPLTI